MDDVLDLERQGWEAIVAGDGRGFSDRVMTPEAVTVLPGLVLDRALMSSVYVREDGRWKLALHQQTPID